MERTIAANAMHVPETRVCGISCTCHVLTVYQVPYQGHKPTYTRSDLLLGYRGWAHWQDIGSLSLDSILRHASLLLHIFPNILDANVLYNKSCTIRV